jgi:hypothetical protein
MKFKFNDQRLDQQSDMERCQDEEEQEQWREICSTTIDLARITAGPATKEETLPMLSDGFCDISFYGEDYCKPRKEQKISMPFLDE